MRPGFRDFRNHRVFVAQIPLICTICFIDLEEQKKRARVHFIPDLKVGVFVTLRAPDVINNGDTAWVLASTALVILMTPCVGLFYGGLNYVGLSGVGVDSAPLAGNIPHLIYMAFQLVFAAVTLAILTSAVAEEGPSQLLHRAGAALDHPGL